MRRSYTRVLYGTAIFGALYLLRIFITSPTTENIKSHFKPSNHTLQRYTDPRWDIYAIGLKTGVETVFERVPIQILTFMRGVKNYYIFGEVPELKVGDEEVVDVLTNVYQKSASRIAKKMEHRDEWGDDVKDSHQPNKEHHKYKRWLTQDDSLQNVSDSEFEKRKMPLEEYHLYRRLEEVDGEDQKISNIPYSTANSSDAMLSFAHLEGQCRTAPFPDLLHKPSKYQPSQSDRHLVKRGAEGSNNSDKDLQPKKTSEGWKLDAHKNLPAYQLLYEKFPSAKWYIMIDDDTYIFMENLHYWLKSLDPDLPLYLGFANHFVGCDGVTKIGSGPPFAHGGSAIVISRKAMQMMMNHIDDCIIKYKSCWAGDVRVGLCLRDSGVKLNIVLSGQQLFNSNTPHYQMHNYNADPCKRVISFHHLRASTLQKLWNIERLIHNVTANNTAHGFDVLSYYYSPVHLEDVWHAFVDTNNEVPDHDLNTLRKGKIHKTITTNSWEGCAEACRADAACRSWSWDIRICHLQSGVSQTFEKKGNVSGIVKGRFKCHQRTS